MNKGYVFFVEGDSDMRFVEDVIEPELERPDINTITYSEEPDSHINNLVETFQQMYRDTYLLRDFDKGKEDCKNIHDRKQYVQKKFEDIKLNRIIVVKDEIEGWYLAGIDSEARSTLGIKVPDNTENIGEDEFKQKLHESDFESEVNFQLEIIDRFDIDTAKEKNDSFDYFTRLLDI